MSRVVNGVHISKHPNRIMGEVEDIRGRHFGNLVVLEFDHKDNQGRAIWNCKCTCGHIRLVRANHLKTGVVNSCGYADHQLRLNAQRKKLSQVKRVKSEHPGIRWMDDRQVFRVSISIGHRKMKYVGQFKTLDEAKQMQKRAQQQFKNNQTVLLAHNARHQNGIIGIDSKGQSHYYASVTEAQQQLGTHANLYRHLKDGSPFTRKSSKLYGWTFKYQGD